MILNFFYENFKLTKQRIHFNEFMINFHDFKFKNKENNNENIIDRFVQN
jgi:cell division protein ZapE